MHLQSVSKRPTVPRGQGPAYSTLGRHPAHPPLVTGSRFRLPETGSATYIKRITIESFLKKSMIMAYPDPNHRLRHLE
jgi:hypothetical protein